MTDTKDFYLISRNECLNKLSTSKDGLSQDEAGLRLAKNGYNEIQTTKKKSGFIRFLLQFKDVMILILLFAAIISIVVAIVENTQGELIDGFIILFIVFLNAVIGFVQENKAEHAMEALKNMTRPEAKVMRNGEIIKVASRFLVEGDIVALEAGDIVPADLRLLDSANLNCDEASLTGESHPVEKFAEFKTSSPLALAERRNMLYSGNIITNGRAKGVVVATGSNTEIGKIAQILEHTEKEETPLQKNLKGFAKIVTIIILAIAAVTFITEILIHPGSSLIQSFLTAVALAVAAIPESLPAVIAIIMSIGVSRLAKKRAIVKRLHAVETLGCCEVICSDKTGTLTQNIMTVKQLFYNNTMMPAENNAVSEDFKMLLKCMTLCNDSIQNKNNFVGDPTETALTIFASNCGFKKKEADEVFPRLNEISFNSKRKIMTTVNLNIDSRYAFTKGAIDNVINLCTKILISGKIIDFTDELKNNILKINDEMASKALRVLACCFKKLDMNEIEDKTSWEQDMVFIGLIGMIDPPRKEVKLAIEKCKKAGMRAVMITGDHKSTAFSIAREIGLVTSLDEVMLGVEIDKLTDEQLIEKLKRVNVFARVSPENKVKIVETYKKLGKVVAMTGDGVNDAPSLKAANIGVGMGITGTDVTKEVADIIITDDNFATIVLAVEEGRKIYKNIQKTIRFLFSANIGEVLSIFIATLAFASQNFVFFLPVQILFVNFITDSLPAIAMGFEPAEKNLMDFKPRKANRSIFAEGVGYSIVLNGIIQTIIILTSYILGLYVFGDGTIIAAAEASTMAFITLNLMQLFYMFSARLDMSIFKSNPFKNKWQLIAFGVGLSLLLIFILTPLNYVLSLKFIGIWKWLVAIGLSIIIIPLSEMCKHFINKNNQKKEEEEKNLENIIDK